MFQDTNSFGSTFASTLDSLGTNKVRGGLIGLNLDENSSQESMLNDDISKQDALIATQKANLTAELNTANQILQAIPSMIEQINQRYSAITGYNRN